MRKAQLHRLLFDTVSFFSDRLAAEQRTAALLTRPLSAPKFPLRDASTSSLPGALNSTPTSSLTRQLLANVAPSRDHEVSFAAAPATSSSSRFESAFLAGSGSSARHSPVVTDVLADNEFAAPEDRFTSAVGSRHSSVASARAHSGEEF